MALKDDINKKDKIIDKAEKRLLDGIKSSEKAIFNKILGNQLYKKRLMNFYLILKRLIN